MKEMIAGILLMALSTPVIIAALVVIYQAATRSKRFVVESLILPVFLLPISAPIFIAGYFMFGAAYGN